MKFVREKFISKKIVVTCNVADHGKQYKMQSQTDMFKKHFFTSPTFLQRIWRAKNNGSNKKSYMTFVVSVSRVSRHFLGIVNFLWEKNCLKWKLKIEPEKSNETFKQSWVILYENDDQDSLNSSCAFHSYKVALNWSEDDNAPSTAKDFRLGLSARHGRWISQTWI